ncbi:MAG TPA: hypothetical protein VNX15_09525 [Gemmatimonadales bacterium]|jgi:hypothetical protein|nr:hypothetical protein [Gemmatimonadales bacterium]
MKSASMVLLAVVSLWAVGCRTRVPGAHPHRALLHAPSSRARDTLALRDSGRSALRRPRVISAPTVIVFWLGATDTLSTGDASSAYDDLTYYTEQVAAELKQAGIAMVPTTADTVYVEGPGHRRRTVVLSGLDYPYGYVLLDPGGPERILTGIYSDDDLLDEIEAYFNIDSDSTAVAPRVAT